MKLSKIVFLLIALFLVFFIIKVRWKDNEGEGWKGIIKNDGRGYYAHLPAIFIYHDLQYNFIEDCENKISLNSSRGKFFLINDQPGNKYFIGEAILLLPFFLLAYVLSSLFGQDHSGYNIVFYGAMAFAAWFYLMAALFYLRKLLLKFNIGDKWISLLFLVLVFATNIFYYVIYEPSMSHIYSFFAITYFLYQVKTFQVNGRYGNIYLAAAALGIITIIRPVNILIVTSIPFLSGSYQNFKQLASNFTRSIKNLLLSAFIFSAIIFLQLFVYYLSYGSFLHWPYGGEKFNFNDPHFLDVLFNYDEGMFIYVPVMFIAMIFIIPYFRRSIFASISFILFFILITFVISSWSMWNYGGAFGMRPFIEYYSILTLPMIVGLNSINRKMVFTWWILIFSLLSVLCMLQTYQYTREIISYAKMTKEKYWKVFLKTDLYYRTISNPPATVKINQDSLVSKLKFFMDFELPENNQTNQVKNNFSFLGSYSLFINKQFPYSIGYSCDGKKLLENTITYAEISLMVFAPEGECDANLILSQEWPSTKIYQYNSYPVGLMMKGEKSWKKIQYNVMLQTPGPDDKLKVYVWNPSDKTIYIDDFRLELFSRKN